MPYKLDNFLVPISSSDMLLKINNSDGIVKHIINVYSITSIRCINNIIKIVSKLKTIDLDFSSTNESKLALSKLQSQIDLLKSKPPLYIDKEIINYLNGLTSSQSGPQGPIGFQGDIGFQGLYGYTGATGYQGLRGYQGSSNGGSFSSGDLLIQLD